MHNRKIDLHTHSTASDGVYTPSEVVNLALKHRITHLALTDHDTCGGIAEALATAAGTDLDFLAGIELATVPEGDRNVDMLGYLYDDQDPTFTSTLDHIWASRRDRAAGMVEKLNQLGVPITYHQVLDIAGAGSVARPHVARALLESGAVSTFQEAFDRYIGDDGPAYVPHFRVSSADAIALLHAAGGVAVLAHPIRVMHLDRILPLLVEQGLDGLEVYYPDHNPDFTMRMRVLARKYDLVMTGGSDFHYPEGNGPLRLGRQIVPPESVDQLRERAARYPA